MSDLTEILQSMGTKRFDECLYALKLFKAICVEGDIPMIARRPLNPLANKTTLIPIPKSTSCEYSSNGGEIYVPQSASQSFVSLLTGPTDTSTTHDRSGEPKTSVAGFTLMKAPKTQGRTKVKEKRDFRRGKRLTKVATTADEFARGLNSQHRSLAALKVLFEQQYSYNLCAAAVQNFKMVDLPKGHVNVSFKEAFESIDVDFVLDKDGVQRCKNAINAFSKDCGLGVLDDDEAEEIVVFIDDFEVLQASQIMTMDKFHNISTVLKKVERAMDWVSNLRQSVFEDVMIGFDEFTSTEKHEHNLAIACCNLKESRLYNAISVFGENILELCSDHWLNTSCILMGILYLREKFPNTGFMNPTFTQLDRGNREARLHDAGSLGGFGFLAAGSIVAGVLHATVNHWTAFIYYPKGFSQDLIPIYPWHSNTSRPTCVLYDCDKSHYSESENLVIELMAGQNHKNIHFVRDTLTQQSDGVNCGPLSLLFLEVHLRKSAAWKEKINGSMEYYRLRYLRHALRMLSH